MPDFPGTIMDVMQRRSWLPGRVERALTGGGRAVTDLTIVVTGASSGIGRAAATQLAARGAHVIAVARRESELSALAAETGCSFRVCDLADETAISALLDELHTLSVDVVVNNAGRSIRRSIRAAAGDGTPDTMRLHDYQRSMALNYFAAVQLTLGLLPGMIDRGRGQFVNVCTWGLLPGTFPRFSAYAASKSALAIFGRSLNAERPHPNICATNVYFPLVRTDMISPTTEYDDLHALEVAEAADWIMRAVSHQPSDVAPAALRALLPVIDYLSPAGADRTMAALT
ncbi:SDR family NAD(P)-dependent oxidoreductase [Gordonia sp. NPDC003425]